MDSLIQLLQNNPLIILIMFIITFFSGAITIILGWKKLYNDILSKKITLPIYAYLIILFFVFLAIIFWPIIKNQPKGYRTIEGESFGVQRVVLDGKRFINCSFDGTELVIKGEAGGEFNNNKLTNIRLTFDGPAAGTIFTLRALYSEPSFRPFIENAFEQIKSGDFKKATVPSKAADK
jgi:hypothetical protein